ncbi:lysylphosphatidylglycerol synthase domain-containing protein [Oceanicella actignis]|uniref:lysylphosphatidylglycerol synthase domain-containing protein n=1 Tax=Oceanicella actignis TaxID=1189325 RepID=UPI0011E764BE|nr:lysylphosphatidylglycerol synthase domain-containing protein [Oceanicella actignis]TYO90139.1 hypothetical protein LY05_01339 [Oceanicella actignis]
MRAGRAARLLGAAAALGAALWALRQGLHAMPSIAPGDPRVLGALAASVGLYLAATLCAAEGWRQILIATGAGARRRLAWSQFLTAQIGKYLPGNVLHLAGRAGLALRDGVPAPLAAAAMALELALSAALALAAALAGAAALPGLRAALAAQAGGAAQLLDQAQGLGGWAWGAGALAAALLAGAVWMGARLAPILRAALGRARPGRLAAFAALQLAVLALLGLSLQAAGRATGAAMDAPTAMAAFAGAWLVGMITPGAPGGAGVREAALVLALGPSVGAPAALACALAHRAASMLGDALACALGLALRAGLRAR